MTQEQKEWYATGWLLRVKMDHCAVETMEPEAKIAYAIKQGMEIPEFWDAPN